MPTLQILELINKENECATKAIKIALPQIEKLVNQVIKNMKKGGRLFYIGAGSSGRYGVVDAVECPPTYGIDQEVIGLIAGGAGAMLNAVEGAEDDIKLAWQEINEFGPGPNDIVIGIAASGRTPYTIGGLQEAKTAGMTTGCIVCNPDSRMASIVNYPIEAIVGAASLAGSTRMGAGTAQKVLLNMITTVAFTKLGYVYDNTMINMKLSNEKLIDRAIRITLDVLNTDKEHDRQISETEISSVVADLIKKYKETGETARVLDIINVFAKNNHNKAQEILEECAGLGNTYAAKILATTSNNAFYSLSEHSPT